MLSDSLAPKFNISSRGTSACIDFSPWKWTLGAISHPGDGQRRLSLATPSPIFFPPFLVLWLAAPAHTTARRPFTVAVVHPLLSSIHRELMWAGRHGGGRERVNVISLGTPAWALCCCRVIDFYMSPARSWCAVWKIWRSVCRGICNDWSFRNTCQLGEI